MTAGASTSWFLDLLPADEAAYLRRNSRRKHAPGAVLCREGEAGRDVHLVMQGRVKVITDTLLGRPVLLALRGPGQLVGEQAMLEDGPRTATAVTVDHAETLVIDGERLQTLLRSHPPLALGLLAQMSRRLRDADRKRAEFAELDSAGRVARRLVELGQEYGESTPAGLVIDLGLTQEDIASWTGASREALIRALASFRRQGWIATERRRITVLDVAALSGRSREGP